jgi:hypothetical protein
VHSVPAYAKTFQDTEAAFIAKTGKSAQGDHIWHPGFIKMLAENLDVGLDEVALEVLIGRWYQERLDRNAEDL